MNPLEKAFDEVIDTLPELDGDNVWMVDRYISDLDNEGNREAFLSRLIKATCAVREHKYREVPMGWKNQGFSKLYPCIYCGAKP